MIDGNESWKAGNQFQKETERFLNAHQARIRLQRDV